MASSWEKMTRNSSSDRRLSSPARTPKSLFGPSVVTSLFMNPSSSSRDLNSLGVSPLLLASDLSSLPAVESLEPPAAPFAFGLPNMERRVEM